jgi:uncharacterized membrane protein
MEHLISLASEKAVIQAIAQAEAISSGEIRVHIEDQTPIHPIDRAAVLFDELGIHQTTQRNGVLFYIAVNNRQFAVLGDEGINAKVNPNFWAGVSDIMSGYFKLGSYVDGLVAAINLTGLELAKHFPRQSGDVNELPNEISFT